MLQLVQILLLRDSHQSRFSFHLSLTEIRLKIRLGKPINHFLSFISQDPIFERWFPFAPSQLL